MWTIAKKELKTYFLSPIGYIFIGIFLLMCSIFFYLDVVQYGSTNFEYMFYSAATVLTFIVPILTMRMFAEERKTGTEQLILTSPVNMLGVVFGKFFAALGVIIVTLLISFMYFFIVKYFGNPNIATVLVHMLGFVLVSSAAISIGMFASSITENQIIAGIITIAFLVMTLFMQDLNSIFANISIMNFYSDFPSGVISLREVVGLVSFTAMFIAFTIIVMQRRKLVK